MTIKPLFDKIVIEAMESMDKTQSGIVLPGTAQEKPQMARVIAVGPGGIIDGKEIVMQIKVGDVVLYNKYAGSDFKLENKEVTILRQADVLACRTISFGRISKWLKNSNMAKTQEKLWKQALTHLQTQ